MNHNPDADTRSPWYEAFAATADAPEARRPAGTRPVPPEAEAAFGGGAEDQWATEALFDCYNG